MSFGDDDSDDPGGCGRTRPSGSTMPGKQPASSSLEFPPVILPTAITPGCDAGAAGRVGFILDITDGWMDGWMVYVRNTQ